MVCFTVEEENLSIAKLTGTGTMERMTAALPDLDRDKRTQWPSKRPGSWRL